MDAIFQQFLNPEIAVKVFPYLMKGFGTTLLLSLLVIPLGLAGGLLVAVLPTLRRRWLGSRASGWPWPTAMFRRAATRRSTPS